jgi:hypothetical protein
LKFIIENEAPIVTFLSHPDLRKTVKSDDSSAEKTRLRLIFLLGAIPMGDHVAKATLEANLTQPPLAEDARVASIQTRAIALAAEAEIARLQAAAVVDLLDTVVNVTYALEIDGPAVFLAHDLLVMAELSITRVSAADVDSAPHLAKVIKTAKYWSTTQGRALAVLKPCVAYFTKGRVKHAESFELYAAIAGLCPWNAPHLTLAALTLLSKKGLVTATELHQIIRDEELKSYLQAATLSTRPEVIACCAKPTDAEFLLRAQARPLLPESRVWRFWYMHSLRLPNLANIVKRLAALQPHSAGAERCLSLFQKQLASLSDNATAELTQTRIRFKYQKAVNPMKNIPLDDIAPFPPL